MASALFIIDVQNDFTEGGSLGVDGGAAVAAGITSLLETGSYDHVFASRDWHDGDNDNGGHFSTEPDYRDTWPSHCVAGTPGAEYHPALATERIDIHVLKGQGKPAYSIFDGIIGGGESVRAALDQLDVTDIDVVGIATDYCVLASGLDALGSGRRVRVLTTLIAGVAPATSQAALHTLEDAGAELVTTPA